MNKLQLIANAMRRVFDERFGRMFSNTNPKHDHYLDYGWPQVIEFEQFYAMWCRNSLARSACNKPVEKTWNENPWLTEREETHEETKKEKELRLRFKALGFWARLAQADERSMVGAYSGVVLRLADGKPLSEPVDRVPGGLKGLVEVIPVWQGQLRVAEWDFNQTSETYGHPKSFQFNESAVDPKEQRARSFTIHPDRVVVWSKDGTVHGNSSLEPGYNDLLTMEKVVGAGGEGFWKNAKSAPVLSVDKDANLQQLASMLGVPIDQLPNKLDEIIADYQKGFDQMLMLQGIEVKPMAISLPLPGEFFRIALESFSASIGIPMKVLIGSQTGERASTEDAKEWNQTIMSRRSMYVKPNIERVIERLVKFRVLEDLDWFINWTDLTEASITEKIDRAIKMADINAKYLGTGEAVFTADEVREVVDYEPLDRTDEEDDLGGELLPDPEDDKQQQLPLDPRQQLPAPKLEQKPEPKIDPPKGAE